MQQVPMAPSYAGYNAPNFAFGQQTYPVMNNRLTALEQAVTGQQAQSMQQVPQMQQQVANNLQCRAVTGKEEALGVPVDFSGALMVFPDVAHGKVYTKAFNMSTGAADFKEYALTARALYHGTKLEKGELSYVFL